MIVYEIIYVDRQGVNHTGELESVDIRQAIKAAFLHFPDAVRVISCHPKPIDSDETSN